MTAFKYLWVAAVAICFLFNFGCVAENPGCPAAALCGDNPKEEEGSHYKCKFPNGKILYLPPNDNGKQMCEQAGGLIVGKGFPPAPDAASGQDATNDSDAGSSQDNTDAADPCTLCKSGEICDKYKKCVPNPNVDPCKGSEWLNGTFKCDEENPMKVEVYKNESGKCQMKSLLCNDLVENLELEPPTKFASSTVQHDILIKTSCTKVPEE